MASPTLQRLLPLLSSIVTFPPQPGPCTPTSSGLSVADEALSVFGARAQPAPNDRPTSSTPATTRRAPSREWLPPDCILIPSPGRPSCTTGPNAPSVRTLELHLSRPCTRRRCRHSLLSASFSPRNRRFARPTLAWSAGENHRGA